MADYVPGGTDRPLGTADWAERDYIENRYRYREGTIWLGRSVTSVPIGYADDRHVCLVSGSRSGKGTSIIINNLCLWPGSLVVLDPKGENASVTAARRGRGSERCEGMGQAVHVIDPFNVATVDASYRARFNPFDALDPNDPLTVDEAARLAEALVIVHPEAKDPFWDDYARNMIRALILHVLTAEQFEGRRHLSTLRLLLLQGDWEKVESLQRQGVEDINSAQGLLWMSLTRNRAFGNLLPALGDSFVAMMQNEPKVFEGVRSVALVNTEFIDSPTMAQCLETSTFRLSDLKTDPAGHSLFLCLPPMYMSQHHRWLRMMITLLVDEMQLVKGKPATGHPVLMMLDEFAALERLRSVEKAVAQIAGYGVKLFFVLQTLEQLKATYKEWETFLANSGLKIFFGVDDPFTREHVSKLIGETEVIRPVKSASDSRSKQQSVSDGTSTQKGTTDSHGKSTSGGSQDSTTETEQEGTSEATTASSGGSRGQSGRRGIFGLVDPNYSSGENWGSSHSFSRTRSKSIGKTSGTSKGWSASHNHGTSTGEGTTHGVTRGTQEGHTAGVADTVHRRALVTPDEIGQWFARIDDEDAPKYPGLGLALIPGQPAVVVRRVNYYEDYQFIGRFEAHPDHGAPQIISIRINRTRLAKYLTALKGILVWLRVINDGEPVAQRDAVSKASVFKLGLGPGIKWEEYPDLIHVRAPVAGRIVPDKRGAVGIPFDLAYEILTYDEDRGSVDPLIELFHLDVRLKSDREQYLAAEQWRLAQEEEARKRSEFKAHANAQIFRITLGVLDRLDRILCNRLAWAGSWLVMTVAYVTMGETAGVTDPALSAVIGLGLLVCLWRLASAFRDRDNCPAYIRAAVEAADPAFVPFIDDRLGPRPLPLVLSMWATRIWAGVRKAFAGDTSVSAR